MLISSVSCVLYVGFAMLVRYNLSCICLLLASIAECMAAVDICQDPSTYSHLSIGFDNHSKSTIEQTLGETDQENVYFDLTINSADDKPMFSGNMNEAVAEDGLNISQRSRERLDYVRVNLTRMWSNT